MKTIKRKVNPTTGEEESFETMLRRFKKKSLADGDIKLVMERRYFKPKGVARREKSLKARLRAKYENAEN